MMQVAKQSRLGASCARREVPDLAEPRKPDTSLTKLLEVRKQRLDRLERERRDALAGWRNARAELRGQCQLWRAARHEAVEFWQQARRDFLSMATTSGEYRRQKAKYLRMQEHVAQRLLECRQCLQLCYEHRTAFFNARRRVTEATVQCEKLSILREQIALMTLPSGD